MAVSSAGVSNELPKGLTKGLIAELEAFFCGDTAFLKCVAVEAELCSESVAYAVAGCDYSPVWVEIQQLDEDEGGSAGVTAEGEKYGSCVNTQIRRQLGISESLFESCINELQERYVNTIRRESVRQQ